MISPLEVIADYSTAAPVDIVNIISGIGITYKEDFLPDQESGKIVHAGDNYEITVNRLHPKVRRRFTAAHELGHYIYHHDLIGDGITDDAAYRSLQEGRYANSKITLSHETQANRFAARVLMPIQLIKAICRDKGIDSRRDTSELARILQVSEQALRIRLGIA